MNGINKKNLKCVVYLTFFVLSSSNFIQNWYHWVFNHRWKNWGVKSKVYNYIIISVYMCVSSRTEYEKKKSILTFVFSRYQNNSVIYIELLTTWSFYFSPSYKYLGNANLNFLCVAKKRFWHKITRSNKFEEKKLLL